MVPGLSLSSLQTGRSSHCTVRGTQEALTMSVVHSSPPPEPWRVADRRSPALARLVGALYRHREQLIRMYPNVVLPTDVENTPTPLAALLLLWANWDYAKGHCPACRSPAVATSFSGVLRAGSVGGFCTDCGMPVARLASAGCNAAAAMPPPAPPGRSGSRRSPAAGAWPATHGPSSPSSRKSVPPACRTLPRWRRRSDAADGAPVWREFTPRCRRRRWRTG